MSCCHGNNIFPFLDGSCQSEEYKLVAAVGGEGGKKGSMLAPESHCILMGFYLYMGPSVCPAIRCLDSSRSQMWPRLASRLNRIDQFSRTYSQSSRITKASSSVHLCMCVSVSVCVCADSHIGMKLFRLKHKWLFHGLVEMPCLCLSRPQEEGEGWSFR